MGGPKFDSDDSGMGRATHSGQTDLSGAESALANDNDKGPQLTPPQEGGAGVDRKSPRCDAEGRLQGFLRRRLDHRSRDGEGAERSRRRTTNSHSSLSNEQLSDLKSIASNIGSMGASAYLEFITKAFVNGDPDNATWTGGGPSTSTLGDLGAGESVKHLNELIGKWFLGTDLPSDTIDITGDGEFVVSYSTVNKSLFGAGGPSMSDINQGQLGDCFFMAPLAEVAQQDPSLIKSMIVGNGDGSYGVRFDVDGAARYATVDNKLANGGNIFNSSNHIWSSLIEGAYAELQGAGNVTGNDDDAANSFSIIGDGGQAEYALEEITGASAIIDLSAAGSNWDEDIYNQSQNITSSTGGLSNGEALSLVEADLAAGNDVLLGSNTNAYDANGNQTLISDHEMSIYGFDTGTDMLEIRNPWGTGRGQDWDTTFEVGIGALLADDDVITTDNVATTISAVHASLVAVSPLHKMA